MLNTEKRNDKTKHIDTMSTIDALKIICDENLYACKAVEKQISDIASVTDKIFPGLKNGGRLFYVGCGTSGRLGVLDASEIPPSYGVYDKVIGIIAGGDKCLRKASENAEDIKENGIRDISEYNINKNDSVVGISVAGGAMYVVGALEYAKGKGAYTVALTGNKDTYIGKVADNEIVIDTGAEPVTGSTRMKAGTAQKIVLNMLSTELMIKLGYVYENFMINMRPTNIKLTDRIIRIVSEITGKTMEESENILKNHNWDIRSAIGDKAI